MNRRATGAPILTQPLHTGYADPRTNFAVPADHDREVVGHLVDDDGKPYAEILERKPPPPNTNRHGQNHQHRLRRALGYDPHEVIQKKEVEGITNAHENLHGDAGLADVRRSAGMQAPRRATSSTTSSTRRTSTNATRDARECMMATTHRAPLASGSRRADRSSTRGATRRTRCRTRGARRRNPRSRPRPSGASTPRSASSQRRPSGARRPSATRRPVGHKCARRPSQDRALLAARGRGREGARARGARRGASHPARGGRRGPTSSSTRGARRRATSRRCAGERAATRSWATARSPTCSACRTKVSCTRRTRTASANVRLGEESTHRRPTRASTDRRRGAWTRAPAPTARTPTP